MKNLFNTTFFNSMFEKIVQTAIEGCTWYDKKGQRAIFNEFEYDKDLNQFFVKVFFPDVKESSEQWETVGVFWTYRKTEHGDDFEMILRSHKDTEYVNITVQDFIYYFLPFIKEKININEEALRYLSSRKGYTSDEYLVHLRRGMWGSDEEGDSFIEKEINLYLRLEYQAVKRIYKKTKKKVVQIEESELPF